MRTGMRFVFATSFPFFVWVFLLLAFGQAEDSQPEIRSRLGLGFGEVTTIEGSLVAGGTTGRKADDGKTLLRVTRIDSVPVEKPVLIEIRIFGEDPGDLPDIGAHLRCRGYETGGFTGIPDQAFEDVPAVATTGHHFESWFMVTRILDTGSGKSPE